jgi:L-threonylcarbamoyladenylate synthase
VISVIPKSIDVIIHDIKLAKQNLIKNELVAIPTETVYGLAANAFSEVAVLKIFALKKRPFYNPLIVHIKSMDYLNEVACQIPYKAHKLAKAFWPGPLTLVLKKKNHIPDIITAGKDTVAIRVPNHPVTLALLATLDFPLAAPSANPFGSISPTTSAHVEAYFKEGLNVILEGGSCERGVESTIIGFENKEPVLYRYGAISLEKIEKVIGTIKLLENNKKVKPRAPGMLSKHYAPHTKTIFTDNVDTVLAKFSNQKIGLLCFQHKKDCNRNVQQEVLSPSGNFEEASHNLYAAMHRLDECNLDLIIAEKLPDTDLGKTINDRLIRANTI